MSYIPQSFIDELLARVDIVDVINTRVPLRKTGRNYMACCPFHNEKTPSFSVVPDKQFFHCFGCQAAGSAVKFVMTFDNIEFVDAVEKLANELNMEIPRDNNKSQAQSGSKYKLFYSVLNQTAEFYQQNLTKNKPALNYLMQRKIDLDIASFFQVGYSPEGWDNLTKYLKSKMDLDNDNVLEQTGLWIRKEDNNSHTNKGYDRFRNRLMFPIRDTRGRVLAFGGRVLDDSKPKYLNSPETTLFHKSQELYGLYESLQINHINKVKITKFVIVEGYVDVVSLFQHGINYAVATLGTATSYRHLAKLFKYSQEVIYCFDGDVAGQNAAWRALENSLGALYDGRIIKFLFLPDGHDPDTYVKAFGKQDFEARLADSVSLTDYLFSHQEKELGSNGLNTVEGRVAYLKLCKPLISKVPQGDYKTILENEIAKRCQLNPDNINKVLNENTGHTSDYASSNVMPVTNRAMNNTNNISQIGNISGGNKKKPSLWRRACLLLVHNPKFAELVLDDALTLINKMQSSHRGAVLFIKLYNKILSTDTANSIDKRIVTIPELIDSLSELSKIPEENDLNNRLKQIIVDLLETDPMVQDNAAKLEFEAILDKLKAEKKHGQMQVLQDKIAKQGMSSLTAEEKQSLQTLLTRSYSDN